ncbi:MAG: TIGR03545 family protein, partial [Planctomycetota bacterium]
MIRWSYVIPRLILIAALVVALRLGINPLVRWALVSAGQTVTSAKVEIGEVHTSLWHGELRLSDVCVANPRRPMENLFEASEVMLDLDTNSLLRRKLIVDEARVSGLRLGTDRETSGALDPEDRWHVKLPTAELADLGRECLDHVVGVFRQRLEEQVEQLESVRLAKELVRRWPAEYARLEARAGALKERIDGLRGLSRVRPDSPIEALDSYQRATGQLHGIQREIADLNSELSRLEQQALWDRESILTAQRRDLQQIHETLGPEALHAEALSEYLLGPETSHTVVTVARWIRWAREHLPSDDHDREPARRRGVDVLFPGVAHRPDFLIRKLTLEGAGQLGAEQFTLEGTLQDLTTQPRLYGRPTVLRVRVEGSADLEVEAVLDRTRETPRSRIVIDCPNLRHDERVLGRPDELALVVSPGSTHLWTSVELEGEALTGQLLLSQEPVELVPRFAAAPALEGLAERFRDAAREIRQIRVVADLSGTLDAPHVCVRSNLGPRLAAMLNRLLERELEVRRDQLLVLARQT